MIVYKKMDNWTTSCRACLSTSESFTYFLFQNISPEVYWFCTSLKVKEDALPKSLCNSCYSLLTKFSEFKKLCIQSENILYNNLKHEDKISLNLNIIHAIDIKNEYNNILVRSEGLQNSDDENPEACNNAYEEENTIVIKHYTSAHNSASKNNVKPESKLKNHRRKFQFSCEVCRKKYDFKERFEAHKLEHEGKMATISCVPCKKTFGTWSGLKKHNNNEHSQLSPDQLSCPLCFRVCKTLRTLQLHRNTHEQRLKICHICGKEYKSDLTLKRHQETHIENRKRRYPCQHCGKNFFTKKSCTDHVWLCHNNRRYICDYCNYSSISKNGIVRHIQIHEGRRHRIYHKCNLCSKTCATKANLVAHQRTHTGERPFSCSDCPKSFITKGRLAIHYRIHTGEKPYQCPRCEKRFSQRGTLNLHMKRRHKIINT